MVDVRWWISLVAGTTTHETALPSHVILFWPISKAGELKKQTSPGLFKINNTTTLSYHRRADVNAEFFKEGNRQGHQQKWNKICTMISSGN